MGKNTQAVKNKRWRFSEAKRKKIRPVPCGTFSSLKRVILLLLFFEYSKWKNGIIERRNWASSVCVEFWVKDG
ncbi:hypothetical protein C6356_29340 [Bacillus wiedmannii]|nr:hypothetical protein C6356_29340 [Bacillus wiedmannii]